MNAKNNQRFRPRIEALEDRRLLANYVLLDFTPDALPGEYRQEGFASAFNLRDAYGRAPAFLDMNGDRVVNGTDVNSAAQQIVNRVGRYLNGVNLAVRWGDVWSDTSLGRQWLQAGLRSAGDQVFVVYVGGRNQNYPGTPPTITGSAHQAPVGYNNEWYALVWSSTITARLAALPQTPTASYFVELTAWNVAHEFGHLVGLGHVPGNPLNDPFNNVMNYATGTRPQLAQYPNVTYNNVELRNYSNQIFYSGQNPAAELRLSLSGQQPTAPSWFRRTYATLQASAAAPLLPNAFGADLVSAESDLLLATNDSSTPVHPEARDDRATPISRGPVMGPGLRQAADALFAGFGRGFGRRATQEALAACGPHASSPWISRDVPQAGSFDSGEADSPLLFW
jgi:hypothetical protein